MRLLRHRSEPANYLCSLGAVPVAYGNGLADRIVPIADLRAAELGVIFAGHDRGFGPQLAGYAQLAADGRLRVRIDQSCPLADAAEAHELSDSGHPRGKLILRP
ncbi:zinc-binding dehydrogenase [Streptomyces swartbergensis]|uniref:Alcohol dehydrogenase-like C-terminal domain-containing protein n=1 Tax=Streptomyces swartbergensis TaxID=487165 RepID=A0A243RT81_9ACTN|nr:zinc-binding dehydrogenase [Streptomyces swartbergensis]OUC98254.1 hypothetical protein CA983_29405 [Streptomyces swartbergensis]